MEGKLARVMDKAFAGERLSDNEATMLYEQVNLLDLGVMAQKQMLRHHGDRVVTFVIDRNINYTNICNTKCKFCAFYRSEDDPEGYVLSLEEIYQKIDETVAVGGTQILMQGGTHPSLSFDFYLQLISNIKKRYTVDIHSFSPPEIVHFAKISGLSIEQVIKKLIDAGLSSLPGGGAEILVDRVRSRVSPNKISAEQWLHVMEIAHHLGLRTTATMVFGLGETISERIEHLSAVRKLQDKTGGFTAFIPWSFQPSHTELGGMRPTTAIEYLKMLAISRIYLDNISNVQASWVTQGGKMAQMALYFGANDFGGTMLEENVVRAAGTSNQVPMKDIIHYIRDAGFTPAQRTTQYEIIRMYSQENSQD